MYNKSLARLYTVHIHTLLKVELHAMPSNWINICVNIRNSTQKFSYFVCLSSCSCWDLFLTTAKKKWINTFFSLSRESAIETLILYLAPRKKKQFNNGMSTDSLCGLSSERSKICFSLIFFWDHKKTHPNRQCRLWYCYYKVEKLVFSVSQTSMSSIQIKYYYHCRFHRLLSFILSRSWDHFPINPEQMADDL